MRGKIYMKKNIEFDLNSTISAAKSVEESESEKLLNTPIEELDFCVRTFNALKKNRLNKVGDIVKLTPEEFTRIKSFGSRSQNEVIDIFNQVYGIEYDNIRGFSLKASDNVEWMIKNIKERQSRIVDKEVLLSGYTAIKEKNDELSEKERIIDEEIKKLYSENMDSLQKGTQKYANNILNMSIDDLKFSARAYNVLWRSGITTVRDITNKDTEDLMRIRNCGKVVFKDIKEYLLELGLTFDEKNGFSIPVDESDDRLYCANMEKKYDEIHDIIEQETAQNKEIEERISKKKKLIEKYIALKEECYGLRQKRAELAEEEAKIDEQLAQLGLDDKVKTKKKVNG